MSHKRSSRWGDDSDSGSDCGGYGSSSATLKRVSSGTPSSDAPKRAKIESTGRITQPSALPDDLPGPKIELDEAPMEMPNFALSGALAKDTTFGNTQNKIVLKHCEPPEARMPNLTWRSYVFEGDDALRTVQLHLRSSYLFGCDSEVAQVTLDHASVSSQHAVIQFRGMKKKKEMNRPDPSKVLLGDIPDLELDVRPYLLDLESTNGTFLNGKRVDGARYYELYEEDVIKFGTCPREYVLMKGKPLTQAEKDEQLGDGVTQKAVGGVFGDF